MSPSNSLARCRLISLRISRWENLEIIARLILILYMGLKHHSASALLLLQSALQPLDGFRPAQLSLNILSSKILQSAVASGTSNPQLAGDGICTGCLKYSMHLVAGKEIRTSLWYRSECWRMFSVCPYSTTKWNSFYSAVTVFFITPFVASVKFFSSAENWL
jgi:hypothetical protein